MPKPTNTLLRVVVPIVLGIVGLGVAWSVTRNTTPPTAPPSTTPATPPSTTNAATSTPATGTSPAPAPGSPSSGAPPVLPPVPTAAVGVTGLRARAWPSDPLGTNFGAIGSSDPAGTDLMKIEFSPAGAGISSIVLARHFTDLQNQVPIEVQRSVEPAGGASLVPMAALGLYVNDSFVNLVSGTEGPVWRRAAQDSVGDFEAVIVNDKDEEVVRIRRRYTLAANSYLLDLVQSATNLTAAPLKLRWLQLGAIDLPPESSNYGGDKRRARFGYLHNATADPSRRIVLSSEFLQDHAEVLGTNKTGSYEPSVKLWPNDKSVSAQYELAWTALTNRYFAVALHRAGDATTQTLPLSNFATIDRVVLVQPPPAGTTDPIPTLGLRLATADMLVAPGQSADLGLGLYAGPLSRPDLRADPKTKTLGLDGLVVYNFGGPCGFITFDWLTGLLFWLLHTLHDYITRDWALSIMLLVVVVRTILHPLTKWSQIRMQRFGKQMQAMGPKQKLVQERYKDDRKKLQEEMAKVWREEGVSPLGALGCLPMFLMTPIWIALYATLYFAFELRHQPAFYGLFQKLSNNSWHFLGDLSEPDRLWFFNKTLVTVPMLGAVSSINILPLILGVVFFIHQKYMTPPTTATLTPEQETQQKIIKVMTVVMFPVFMYNAPSGLSLYFITNSVLGIIENKYIRAHIDEHDLLNVDKHKAKKTAGGGGFMDRLQKMAQERAKLMEQAKAGKGKGGELKRK